MTIKDEDKEFLDGLTEEERAALMEGDDDTETTNEGDDDTDTGEDEAGGTDGADDDADAGDDDAADGADADGQVDTAKAAAATEPEAKTQPAPLLIAEAPADAEARIKSIADQKSDLRKKYDDGDVTFEEYEQQKEKLDTELLDLKLALKEAETAEKLRQQQEKNQWDAECNAFLAAHEEYSKDEALFGQLNEAVITIAKMPSNKNLTGPQLLEKAHKIVLVMTGRNEPAPQKEEAKPEQRKIPRQEAPPSLAKVPAAAATEAGEGRFAALDRLAERGGIEYENALAALSDAEREAYLRTT